ncbi:hypothetical protein [Lactobacillus gallinarum]|nr:hypothetical protein [Lactobacillus gallinarum]MBM6974031.1 hypothetical protein [Lactobacillus gallinarum]
MLEKEHPIVALDHPKKPRKARPPRNNLMISLKKDDLPRRRPRRDYYL